MTNDELRMAIAKVKEYKESPISLEDALEKGWRRGLPPMIGGNDGRQTTKIY